MKTKHVPARTCIACRTTRPKRELLRVVRSPEGEVVVDDTGKRNGRGAYLCRNQACWKLALKCGSLNRALRQTLTQEEIAKLEAYSNTLPEKDSPVQVLMKAAQS